MEKTPPLGAAPRAFERSRFSLCEWVLGPVPFEEVCRLAAGAGSTGVHVRGGPRPRDPASLRAAARAAGVQILGVTPNILWPRDGADLANPDPDVRARGNAYYRSLVDLAAQLGAPAIDVVPACEGRLRPISTREDEWELAVSGLKDVAAYARGRGIRLGIEALNRYETYLVTRLEEAAEMVNRVAAGGVGVVADAFHMSIEEHDPASAVSSVGPLLIEVQLADSNRRAPGLGHSDLAGIVHAACARGYTGPWVMEFLPRDAPRGVDEPPDLERFRSDLSSAIRSVTEETTTGGSG